MRRMAMRGRTAVVAAVCVLASGCTAHQSSPASQAISRSSAGPQAGPGFSPSAACAAKVPGAQHVILVTVGQVRRQGLGIVGPAPAVASFAANDAASDKAAYCYRWLPTEHLDQWWGVSASGAAVLIGAFGGETHDVGTFEGGAFD